LHPHELVAGAAALETRHPVAGEPEGLAARRLRRDLHGDLPLERGHRDFTARGAVARAAAHALGGHAHARAGVHARRDLDLQVPPALGPAAAPASGAGAPIDVAGATALGARLVEVERDRLLRPVEGLLEGELD